ncbi:hypothetical protein JW916_12635 [Candidatus Sumerlaeota bacterium]|nr:hypothetical protein [Candidatus Sumerlaeota bacterium]
MRDILVFAVLVWILVSVLPSVGSARAPIIKDLSDIVIGDTGDIDGSGTTAFRLYRYLNIVNLLDPNVIEWLNAAPLSEHYVFLYQPTASEPTIQASTDAAILDPLTGAEYTALLGSGTAPTIGDNLIDAATSFTYLSLINTDIMTGSPSNAYSATAAANGVETGLIPSGDLGDTDLILVAVETDLPASPSLVSESPQLFTVVTVMDYDDLTTSMIPPPPPIPLTCWFAFTDFGEPGLGPATPVIDYGMGAIGWDATGSPSGSDIANYGTWYLSDDGVRAEFLVPSYGMEDRIYRVRARLISDQAARASTCSWRLLAISYMCVAWQGVQVLTQGGDEVDAPISTDSSFEAQIHFTPPYGLSEWATPRRSTTQTGSRQETPMLRPTAATTA